MTHTAATCTRGWERWAGALRPNTSCWQCGDETEVMEDLYAPGTFWCSNCYHDHHGWACGCALLKEDMEYWERRDKMRHGERRDDYDVSAKSQDGHCPHCHSQSLEHGFGVAAGGYGPYMFCLRCQRFCDYRDDQG